MGVIAVPASGFVRQCAEKNGIIVGVCGVSPFVLEESPQGFAAPFIHYTREQRENPAALLPGAKSIIVIGGGYNRELAFTHDGAPRGRFSLNAVGTDYHITLGKALEDIEDTLRRQGYVFECRRSVDTGPLPERLLAVRAGLGWMGKHGLVISEAFGSFFNIGYMITTIDIGEFEGLCPPEETPCVRGLNCGECNMCLAACPGGAFTERDGETAFDYTRCVSYLTQKKGELTEGEKHTMGTSLYGCDLCQKACVHNQNTYVGAIRDIDYAMPRLEGLLNITRQEFDRLYRSSAIFWRGPAVLRRNAAVAMGNLLKIKDYFQI